MQVILEQGIKHPYYSPRQRSTVVISSKAICIADSVYCFRFSASHASFSIVKFVDTNFTVKTMNANFNK